MNFEETSIDDLIKLKQNRVQIITANRIERAKTFIDKALLNYIDAKKIRNYLIELKLNEDQIKSIFENIANNIKIIKSKRFKNVKLILNNTDIEKLTNSEKNKLIKKILKLHTDDIVKIICFIIDNKMEYHHEEQKKDDLWLKLIRDKRFRKYTYLFLTINDFYFLYCD